MGGIAGFVHFKKKPTDDILLKKMSSTIAHRGPDGISYHIFKHAGLCQLTSHITPESEQEAHLPATSHEKHCIVFHGRIDNRKDLYLYSDQKRPLNKTADSQLVMAAYRKWGTQCIEKLLGDFAFAIWDEDEQTLFCGRDQMGVKPFFHIKTGTFFAFASEIKGLFALPGIPKEVNSEKIADFTTCLTTENESTFYKNIFKLPPAHYLTVKDSTVTIKRYWNLEPADIQFKNSHEYQEAFFDIFKEAVHVRLRSSFPVGATLSGGIDSTSIVSMATGLLNDSFPGTLNTFTGIFDQITECDERTYFQPILDQFPILPHYVHGDELLPGESFDAVMDYEDEPFFSPHFFMGWHLKHKIKQKGIKVLLDGHDGDSAVSYGYGLLPQLAMQGKLIKLYQELMSFPQASAKKSIRNILNLYYNILIRNVPFYTYQSASHSQFLQSLTLLNPTFRRQTNIESRVHNFIKTLPNPYQPEKTFHKLNISQPFHPFALEFIERTASRFGIEQRLPFFDIRLISFCLALPAEQKFKNGYNRSIVRDSLKTILPATIRHRKQKTNFAKNFLNAYVVRDRTWLTLAMEQQPHGLFSIIDKDEIQKTYKKCLEKDNSSIAPLCNVLRYLALSKWLTKIA